MSWKMSAICFLILTIAGLIFVLKNDFITWNIFAFLGLLCAATSKESK